MGGVGLQITVNNLLKGGPEFTFFNIAFSTYLAECFPKLGSLRAAVGAEGAVVLMPPDEFVEAEGDAESDKHDDHGLDVDGGTALPQYEPDKGDNEVHDEDGDGGAEVGEAHVDEEVVEVRLVGSEGRVAPHDPCHHDAQGVEDGDAEDRECECGQADATGFQLRCAFERHGSEGENSHEESQHHGASVADEHLRLVAEDVVQEERYQCARHDDGQG